MLYRKLIVFSALCIAGVNAIAPTKAASNAGTRPVKSIMICYFLGDRDYRSRPVGAALGRMLRYRASNLYQLSNLPPLDVVDRVVREQRLRGGLALNTQSALRVARATGQDLAVVGMVRRFGGRYQIRGYIYDTPTGHEIGSPVVLTGTEPELPRLEARLSAIIFGAVAMQLTVRQRNDLSRPLTTHYQAIVFLGNYLLADQDSAPSYLRRMTAADPSFPLGADEKADRLLQAGRYWDALTVAREWNARLPLNRDFASCKFGALLGTGRVSEAAALLKEMETMYPRSFSVAVLKYWLLRINGDERGALVVAGQLGTLNPSSSEAYGCYASTALRLAFRTGNGAAQTQTLPAREVPAYIQTCRVAAEKAVNLDPNYEDAWLALMAAYREQGDLSSSSTAFQRLIALNPHNGDAMSSQALNYLCKNDVTSARNLWSACFSADRRRADSLVGLALCAKASGKTDLARGHFRRAAAMDKRCTSATYLRTEKCWPAQLTKAVSALGAISGR